MPAALEENQGSALKPVQNSAALCLLTIVEATHGRRHQTNNPGAARPALNHDGGNAAARWLATSNDGWLRERRFEPVFSLRSDSQKAKNLARDDRLSLTIDHDTADLMAITGLSMAARAQAVLDWAEAEKVLCMLPMKTSQSQAAWPRKGVCKN